VATIAGKAVLVTGANRGIGRALVGELVRRGADRVYAGTRESVAFDDGQISPVLLDVTRPEQVARAIEGIPALDVLVNNAGIARFDDLTDPAVLEQHLAVNLVGSLRTVQAALALLTQSRGTVVNHVSIAAFAPVPVWPAYSASKAAAFSLTQSLRLQLAERGVRVQAVLTGPVDTEMTREFQMSKSSPESVAGGIVDGIEAEDDEIFPDPMSLTMADSWRTGANKALERQFAALAG
jgi:NAD(P)-dependent dehydrogenase (short-subunit alcohol dehydrogenase family)